MTDTEHDEQPPLGEEWETDWPDSMDAQDRVESVAVTVRQPRSAQWISERAGVSVQIVREHLEQLVEHGELQTRMDGDVVLYARSPF